MIRFFRLAAFYLNPRLLWFRFFPRRGPFVIGASEIGTTRIEEPRS